MIGALSALAASALVASALVASEPSVISVEERAPMLMYPITPRGRAPSPRPIAAFLEAADRALRAKTSLAVRSIEQAGVDRTAVDACTAEDRLSCWVRSLRDRRPAPAHSPSYLLVLTVQAEDATHDALSAMLINLDRAQTAYERAESGAASDPPSAPWRERAEEAIFAGVVQSPPAIVATADAEPLERYFTSLFGERFRPELSASGCWKPYGSIALAADRSGWPIEIDGALVGTTQAGTTSIRDLRPGPHQIVVDRGEAGVLHAAVTVEPERESRISASAPASPPGLTVRTVTEWTGLGIAAAGVALEVLAAAKAGDGVRAACIIRPGAAQADCPSIGTPSFGYDPARTPSEHPSSVNPPGVYIAPLGAALILSGGLASTSTWLFGQDNEIPWIEILAGLVAGALAYTAGALLHGG